MSKTFSVKNFEKFQHYKDRSPPWIKLYNDLLDDYAFGALPDASKAHLIAIWLLASRYSNEVPADATWVARRINATEPVDLEILRKAGFLVFSQACSETLAQSKQSAMPEREEETETEREGETEKRPAQSAARRKMPDEWPSVEDRFLAEAYWRALGRDDLIPKMENEVAKARAHHAGKGTRSPSWSAVWVTWYSRAVEYSRPPSPQRTIDPNDYMRSGQIISILPKKETA